MTNDKAYDIKPPPGIPKWVTPELLADTLEIWQPYYREPLTVADSLGIILCVSKLAEALTE